MSRYSNSKHRSISISPLKARTPCFDSSHSLKGKRSRLLIEDPVNEEEWKTIQATSTTLSKSRGTKKNVDPYAFDIKSMRKSSIQVVNKEAARSIRSSLKAISSKDDGYVEELQFLRAAPAMPMKLKAAPSRTGTASDPYAFDLRKIRSYIRRESLAEATA